MEGASAYNQGRVAGYLNPLVKVGHAKRTTLALHSRGGEEESMSSGDEG